MTEYGIFNDEGFIEGDFYSREAAEAAVAARYSDDDCSVHEVCPEHRDQPRDGCEECAAAEGDEDEDETDESEDE